MVMRQCVCHRALTVIALITRTVCVPVKRLTVLDFLLIADRLNTMAASHENMASGKALAPSSCREEKEASNEVISAEPSNQHSSTVSLSLIVGSIMLAVFLTTLDQVFVGSHLPHRSILFAGPPYLTKDRQLSARLYPKSRMSFTVSHKSPGTAPRTFSPSAFSGPSGGRSASSSG